MLCAPIFALLPFLPLAPGLQDGPTPDTINTAIDDGSNYLVHMQQPDGSWGTKLPYLPGNSPAGETALIVAALIHSGLDLEHQAVQRGLAFVRQTRPKKYYGACTRLLMEQAVGVQADQKHMDDCIELIVDGAGLGYWDYPGGAVDLSNTQYALLGLWLAHQSGLSVKDKIFEKVLSTLMQYQLVDGGWAYFGPSNSSGRSIQRVQKATASMTTAAMATMLFAYDRLSEKKANIKKYKEDLDASVKRGLDWLDQYMSYTENVNLDTENPSAGGWFFYYVYNIERLGTISGNELLGGKPWYDTGAAELVKRQGRSGGWGTQNTPDPIETAFALLFLNRATKSIQTGAEEHKSGFLMANDSQAVPVDLRIQPGVKCYGFIAQFGKEVRERYAVDGKFGLHIDEVKYFVDGELFKKFDADVNRNSGSERFTCKLKLEPGPHEVQVVVVIAPAPEKGAEVGPERIEIRSQTFRLDVDWTATKEQELAMQEVGANLAVSNPPTIAVSSERPFENPNEAAGGMSNFIGARATDGGLAYGWVAKKEDVEPWILMTWKKGIKVQTLVLSGARVLPRGSIVRLNSGEFSAPKRVLVEINGKETEYELADEVRQRIELPKVTSIKSLQIKILETYLSDSAFEGTGFAEVELLGKSKKKKKRK